eukprot:GEMP01033728.1.p1 GENE.GEMP01033728.1~~GEMP01033728.1.p1  ORF type:complete len:103 (+),score=4.10 GEMP01033728.1:25-333(+)
MSCGIGLAISMPGTVSILLALHVIEHENNKNNCSLKHSVAHLKGALGCRSMGRSRGRWLARPIDLLARLEIDVNCIGTKTTESGIFVGVEPIFYSLNNGSAT